MYLPYLYMALTPIGLRFGEDCVDFINSTVCFLSSMPYVTPSFAVIEPIQYVHTQGCQRDAPWHLQRLVNSRIGGSADYVYDGDGSSVDVYVLDTWVDCSHREFEGRCREIRRFAPHAESARPLHGTHVAGLVGSRRYGVAKRANIRAVVVLNDEGTGAYDDFVRALQYVMRTVQASKRRSIVNMSIKGPKSQIMDRVVEEMQTNNVAVMVIAAGNDAMNACEQSPNSKRVAIVGATNTQNVQSSFSNTGACVSILAPGESIASLCPDQHECWMSGTSMAAPAVAGAIAAFWDTQPKWMNVETAWQRFREMGERDKIKVRGGTPNLLAHLAVRSRCGNSDGSGGIGGSSSFLFTDDDLLLLHQ